MRADADGFERVDGSVQWLRWEVRPWRDTMGDVAGIVIFTEDITERKRAERALQEAHERATRLARFPEENPNPVVRVSARATFFIGIVPAGKLPGWTCEVGMLLPDSLLPMTKEAMRDGEEARQELELGGRFYSVSVVPIPAEHYVNIYATDITERKQRRRKFAGHAMIWKSVFKNALRNSAKPWIRFEPNGSGSTTSWTCYRLTWCC